MRWFLLTALLSSAVAVAGDPNVQTEEPLALGRRFTLELYEANTSALWSQSGPAFRRRFPTIDSLKAYAKWIRGQFGGELRVGAESVQYRGALTVYTRLSIVPLLARGIEVQWAWDTAGILASLEVHAAVSEAPSPYLDTTIKTQLHLPFEGPWYVLWGGRDWQQNPHSSVNDQRFAIDFFLWGGRGSFTGDGTRNESYLCWGKSVLAPADGQVAIVEDGLPDNLPGQVNPARLFGNSVVIDHQNGEFSLLGHLMKGSIGVKVGESVKTGQPVGRTGNSGVSTEPHLHFQLMDSAQWLEAHGMPSVFVEFLADGKPCARGEPRRAMTVAPLAK